MLCTPPVYRARELLRFRPGVRAVGREHLGDAQAELLVDHDDLAAGDRLAVDQQVDGLAGEPVERHDGAGPEGERLADRHPRAADLHRELHLHVVQARELLGGHRVRSRRGLRWTGGRGFEGCVIDSLGHGYWTVTSVKRMSCTFTSVCFLRSLRISSLSCLRPLRSTSSRSLASVRSSVMTSRTTASWAIVPKPSGGLGAPSPSAAAVDVSPSASTRPTVSLANRPSARFTRNSLPST